MADLACAVEGCEKARHYSNGMGCNVRKGAKFDERKVDIVA